MSEDSVDLDALVGSLDADDDLTTLLGVLVDRFVAVEDYQAQIVRNHMQDRLDSHEQAIERIGELENENEELRAQLHDLRGQLDTLAGLADDQRSTPEKRTADIRTALIRRAKARSDGEDRAAMHYQDIMNALADLGHENIHKPQAFRVMEDAAEAEGFTLGETDKDGNMVKAVKVDLDALPAHVASNEITTGEGVNSTLTDSNHAD